MPNTWIQKLSADTPQNIQLIGGKACGLVRLLKSGLPVPEAWVLDVPSLRKFAASSNAVKMKQLKLFWSEFSACFPGQRIAVRSSAIAEDTEDASFAGIYETVLNVIDIETTLHAISFCLDAAEQARVESYKQHSANQQAGMALVLQRMLEPQIAGVYLTENPLQPFAAQTVINASYGLGEAVVSGLVQPDQFVLKASTGELVSQSKGAKELQFVYKEPDTIKKRVSAAKSKAWSLSESQIQELWRMGQAVERHIGARQDLEWAIDSGKMYLLQQRPITGLPPLKPHNVWSRRFGDEYLSEYATPLSYTLLVEWINNVFLQDFAVLFGFEDKLKHPPTRRHFGYAYISGEYIKHLLSALPAQYRESDAIEWFTPLWLEKVYAQKFAPQVLYKIVAASFSDSYTGILRNQRLLQSHCDNLQQSFGARLTQPYDYVSSAAWQQDLKKAIDLGVEHFRIIRWGMGFYNPSIHSLLQRLLVQWCGDKDHALYRTLITGLGDTHTSAINLAIWQLGQRVRKNTLLSNAFEKHQDYSSLREATKDVQDFWALFEQFLRQHGHRSASREISQKRWSEDPHQIVTLIRVQLGGVAAANPAEAEERMRNIRLQAEKALATRLGPGPGRSFKHFVLKKVLGLTHDYTRYRENQRYFLDYLLSHIRFLLKSQAHEFVRRGILAHSDEIFFVERTELFDLVAQQDRLQSCPESLQQKIQLRREEYEIWKHRVPATYLFDGVETEGELVTLQRTGEDAGGYWGTAASVGIATAQVRVVRSVQDLGELQAGEIMVATNTDPAWTSVFPRLAGLITETGGMLSHGALLAREYNLPAVTGIADAMQIFKTGQTVQMDGGKGWVCQN